jgi:DnaK suppressor protein
MPSTATAHFEALERLRRERRAELEARLRELRTSPNQSDPVDVSSLEALSAGCASADVSAVSVEILSRTLQSIELALKRLQSGRYGICGDCDAPISQARLRAMPFAERCRDCQELAEAADLPLAA